MERRLVADKQCKTESREHQRHAIRLTCPHTGEETSQDEASRKWGEREGRAGRISLPSFENATHMTALTAPSRDDILVPVRESHILTVRSSELVRSIEPLVLCAKECTCGKRTQTWGQGKGEKGGGGR